MMSLFTRILVIGALLSSFMAAAQTGSASQAGGAPLPSAPSSASTNEPPVATGNKVATINITGALAGCNEGQRDFGALDKKFEPRQTELSNMNKELEGLKTQLNAATTEVARAPLVKQIEQKQKAFERTRTDAADDYQNQQNDVASRILAKMAPVMVKYAADNGSLTMRAMPLRTSMVGDTRAPLLVLMASASLVLLITCANLAASLLSRALSRKKEFAVRAAGTKDKIPMSVHILERIAAACSILSGSTGGQAWRPIRWT